MKVLFDYDGFRGKVGGVPRCTVELIKHFPEYVDVEISIAVCDNIHFLDSQIKPSVRPCAVNDKNFITRRDFRGKRKLFELTEKIFPSFPSYSNVNKPLSIAALKKQDFDVFHCPSTTADTYFLEYLQNKPFVLTVHDMISELFFPPNNSQTRIKSKLVPLASHIVTVSQNTKRDLMRIMNVPEKKISVVYHGAPRLPSGDLTRLLPEPYFLYIGRREKYKNFDQTLIDFAAFHRDFPEVSFVVVGGAFNSAERGLVKSLGVDDCVKNILASESELVSLYKNAIGFIFPSLYEGFGLPILEAFTYECPVLLNDTSCFPEIAKDAGVFFHSRPEKNESNLPEVMRMVYSMSNEERRVVINNGLTRRRCFTWEDSSRRLAEIYGSVL